MFRSGVTLFGVLVGFLPWTRTTHKDKSHRDHAAAHVERLQIALHQFDAKDYPKKSEDSDIPDLLDTEDAKESDAELKTLATSR